MTEIALRPTCPNGHGPMTLRPPATYTREQAWCGTWYVCTPAAGSCKSSVLLPSPELTVTPSRTDRQAPNPVAGAKGGLGSGAPGKYVPTMQAAEEAADAHGAVPSAEDAE